MDQSEKLLGVVVIEIGVIVLSSQVFGELPIATSEVELVAFTRTAGDGQSCLIGRATARRVFDPTASQSQILELARSDLTTFEGLWQHAPIIGD
ncbi:hypothetical protein D3C85_1185530 [compost metagenome]